MGQKIHPLSLRIQSSTRYFDQAWYSDHFFSKLISIDISVYKYLKNFLTLLKLPTARLSIYHLPKTTKLYNFFCYPKQSRESKSRMFNITTNLADIKTKKHKFLAVNQFKSSRNSLVDPLLSQKILSKNHLASKIEKLNVEITSFFNNEPKIPQLDSLELSSISSKNLQKLLKQTNSSLFQQQYIHYLTNSYNTPNVLLTKNSSIKSRECKKNHDETLLMLGKFLLFSKIFHTPYNMNEKFAKYFQHHACKARIEFHLHACATPVWKYNENLETTMAKYTQSDINLIPFQINSEWQDAGYFADEIVFLLERRLSFRQIKNKIFKQLALNPYIQGVRITCSGRVGGKSKKAQRAKIDSIKYGQTSLHIFSSRIDFAVRTAYTSLGSTGVKVWVCYK